MLWLTRNTQQLMPFIPFLLSARMTTIDLFFPVSHLHEATIASVINTLPTLCPNLREIHLIGLQRDPSITAAVSNLVLKTNRSTLRSFRVDSPLTDEAREMIYKHPDLYSLHTFVNGSAPLPTMVLPNLADMDIRYCHGHDWLQCFLGASLRKLTSITISPESDSILDNILEAFETVALTTSIPMTLSMFELYATCQWRPSYRSLFSFTQLRKLVIESSCDLGCSSTIDDDTAINLARAMPELWHLQLGDDPCGTPAGVTVKGLAALAYYCPNLSSLAIHFQVGSFTPLETPSLASIGGSTISPKVCALTTLQVAGIRVPAESALMVALTLLRISPYLEDIEYYNAEWGKVSDAMYDSRRLAQYSSEICLFAAPRSVTDDHIYTSTIRGNVRERYLIAKR